MAPLSSAESQRLADAGGTEQERAAPREENSLWDEAGTDISLNIHAAGLGDTPAAADGWGGNPNKPRRIEGFSATLNGPGWSRDVVYRAVLPDGELGPAIKGGQYCGTRGRGQALLGFVLDVAQSRTDLANIVYEGVFDDGFHSGLLTPGEICVSPAKASLIAMRIALNGNGVDAAAPENIRLVIWDLDEVFWNGTLTEGGIVWREENAQIVRALAARGIVSSICSKNDPDDVFGVLDQHGMRDFFVFPSISLDAKGPRLAALIDSVQLRAPSVLFIDDNPLNRAEAEQFVPGLQVRDENCVEALLQDPLLQGKPDPDCTRLAQYRLLDRRDADRIQAAGDTTEFLRASNISVFIEHDIEPHIDRAVELINRTNQLNFTKARLPDDPQNPQATREALRMQLARHNVVAALIHVRDRYGDYGYCGFYMIRRDSVGIPELLHFAFSCRILGMGVETWLYRALNRPLLRIGGKVSSDPAGDDRPVDWIRALNTEGNDARGTAAAALSHVLLRGSCELRPLAHYFAMLTGRVIEELDTWRAGQLPLLNHSVIASQALYGIDERAIDDAAPLGFISEDFTPFMAGTIPQGPAVWVLGFALEQPAPLFRHNETGTLLPWTPVGLYDTPDIMMGGGSIGKADPAVVAHLRKKFSYVGRRPNEELDAIFRHALLDLFGSAPKDISVFVLLSNAYAITQDGRENISEPIRQYNSIISDVAGGFSNVELLSPRDFMTSDEMKALTDITHFDRIVYYRMFRHIAGKVGIA